jgi:hypothetical protein
LWPTWTISPVSSSSGTNSSGGTVPRSGCSQRSGELLTNDALKIEARMTQARSTGAEPGGACHTTTPLGYAVVSWSGFPWPVLFRDTVPPLNASFRGTNAIAVTWTYPEAGGMHCTYESRGLRMTYKTGGQLALTMTEQLMTRTKKGNSPACLSSAKFNGHWRATSGGEAVETEQKK